MSNKPPSNAFEVPYKPFKDAIDSLQKILNEANAGLITARTLYDAKKAMQPFTPVVAGAVPDLNFIGAPSNPAKNE